MLERTEEQRRALQDFGRTQRSRPAWTGATAFPPNRALRSFARVALGSILAGAGGYARFHAVASLEHCAAAQ